MEMHIEKKVLEIGNDKICFTIDSLKSNKDEDLPILILPPAFNKTIRDYFLFSIYFTYNGFRVIRFDVNNHVGSSSGNVFDYKMTDCLKSLNTVCEYVEKKYANVNIYVLGTSLIGRVVIKQLSMSNSNLYSHVGLLIPVVDAADTIRRVSGIDYVGMELNGQQVNEMKLLNNIVSGNAARDIIINNYAGIKNCIKDLSQSKKPVSVFVAEQDEWVDVADVHKVFNEYKYCESFISLNYSSHQLDRNLKAAKLILEQIVSHFSQKQHGVEYSIITPNFNDIVYNSKIDRMQGL